MLKIPVKKAAIPQIPASRPDIASAGLLKNVSPPRCPEITSNRSSTKNRTSPPINPIDHFPGALLGTMLIFIFKTYSDLTIVHYCISP